MMSSTTACLRGGIVSVLAGAHHVMRLNQLSLSQWLDNGGSQMALQLSAEIGSFPLQSLVQEAVVSTHTLVAFREVDLSGRTR